ncbi:hypothetical protein Vadar_009953 [Vaccinium darrowii]|uniref:Uncharacterized protein n=1 Tax=Vaccinium darrowii TaxID=229202 RepID=A0ACB7XPW7_9ERIC|nr:hypothetical protein Vadar_009953 [Vaccinium darrowii]
MLLSDRFSQPYIDGVKSFIDFAKMHSGEAMEIKCPCINCCNFYKQEYTTVEAHLLISGIKQSYTTWLQHGELPQPTELDEDNDESDENQDEFDELIEDHHKGTYMGDTQEREDFRNFEKLLESSQRALYPGCDKSDTLLSYVIEMLQVRVQNGWSNKSFNDVLKIQQRIMPKGNVIPGSIDECKKLLCDLGLGYEVIHVCKNDCALFWKENAHLEKCPSCVSLDTRSMTAKLIVRLGLATDGFNPFGNMSTSYSMWPVILMPYNLPPWMCMKEPFFMMSLLIPGPNQPGTNIDVYLRPLVDELKELWDNGVKTYDAFTEETFQMHAAVMWTINDFPAYGDLSGWRTKGYLACPTCNDNPILQSLIDKLGWVGHRAYLPKNHRWRKDKKFNGLPEHDLKSLDLAVEKVLAQLDKVWQVKFGKDPTKKKRPCDSEELNWTKKSILWELPYWKNLKLRHNLDVMHIEKNICESIYGTMLAIEGKNKDTYKARDDLKKMGIRSELHLQINENGSFLKPRAIYTLGPQQIDAFCEFLKSISYPDGYAANISRCVTSKKGNKLSGMKSHDRHVLLQRILPIGMRGLVNKEISTTLFELGSFFQELCSRTLRRSVLEKMEEQIVLILCKLVRIFPPAFFDVMVHLAVHLPRDAMLAGPVQYRWMYPIERFLGTLKGYVSNKARPEGSIAEAYIVQECLTFCSMYLKKGLDKPERNDDGDERGSGMEIFKQNVRLFSPISRAPNPSNNERELAHWFVLFNSPEVDPYLDIILLFLLRSEGSSEATDELWSLANGSGSIIDLYSGCISNGIRFHTKDRESRRRCQNSGLVVEGDHNGMNINFYGYLCKIWELRYLHGENVVLFQCECQTRQVFYVNDTNKGKNWRVVELVRHRGVWDVPERDDVSNIAFQQDEPIDCIPICTEDTNIFYSQDDVDPEIVGDDEQTEDHLNDKDDEDDTLAEYLDEEEDELNRRPNFDLDLDIDCDI